MVDIAPRTLWFDRYVLDLERGCLRADDRELVLRPKALKVLQLLVENAGRLVAKDELQRVVWRGVVVTDASLTQCIRQLRQALDDREQRFIKTVSRRGYLFAAQVFGSDPNSRCETGSAAWQENKPSIAILPFENMSGDPEQEYFADGMVEEITTALSRFKSLFVVARNSSFTFKGKSVDVREVGRQLGVRYILEGSIRKSGDRLRITAQLIDASSGGHVWAERYDRPAADLFAVQDEITESVVASIEPQLLLAEESRHKRNPTASIDAWGYVARAYAHRAMASREEAERALGFVERALEIDPDYPPALAEYALIMGSLAVFGFRDDRERSFEMALAAARKATALDPADPVSRAAQGVVCRLAGRCEEALPALLKAVELNPNYAYAHAHLGFTLALVGRPEEGLRHAQRALRLSPRDPYRHIFLLAQASALFCASRYPEAIELAQLVLQERAGFPTALQIMAASLALIGKIARAADALRELQLQQPGLSLASVDQASNGTDESRGRMLQGLRLAGFR